MSLDTILENSEKKRQEESIWISTVLGEEGSILCEQYLTEEVGPGQFGEQLVVTVVASGMERKLGRPYPLSNESARFIRELMAVKDNPPFIIEKKMDKKGNPVYYAKPVEENK